MPLPDYRIKFPPTLVDFQNEVGITGQDHDSYPAPGQQARYDWLRLYLIGLLSNQASSEPPVNYREGTCWLDMSVSPPVLKIRLDSQWVSISDAIDLNGISLSSWVSNASAILSTASPELFFSGKVTSNTVTQIPIPVSLQSQVYSDTRAFVTVNSASAQLNLSENQNLSAVIQYRPIILNPNDVEILAGTTISLSTIILEKNDTYMVSLRRIPNTYYDITTQQI